MDDHHVEEGEQTPPPTHRRRSRLRVPTLLVIVALLPVIGMLVIVYVSGERLEREQQAADHLREDTAEMARLIDARTAIGQEEVASAVLVIGAELGVTPEQLEAMFDQDFRGQLAEARARVGADPELQQRPRLARMVLDLVELRPQVDAGEVTFAELLAVTETARDELELLWAERVQAQNERSLEEDLPAAVQVRFQALTGAFLVLTTAADRALLTEIAITQGADTELLNELVDATGAYRTIVDAFVPRLGPKGLAAWDALSADPASNRFLAVLDTTLLELLAGQPPSLSGDPGALGDAFIDGPAWADRLTTTATATAEDLRDLAAQHAEDAAGAVRTQRLLAGAVAVLSLVAALALARSVSRPARRLSAVAHQIQEGRFALDPLPETGPRELSDTARAFNEMTATLAAVERHAVALADDIEDPVLREELPGRTGRALQVALNRLRHSMKVADQRREELQQAATHDGLTGLLNRAAAFEVLSRDLLRTDRGAGRVVALFVDMDGLKPINDRYGHGCGDDALTLTAEALREATRASDVVARLGGDEFLVAGVMTPDDHRGDEEGWAEELAERVRASVASRAVSVGDGAVVPLRCTVGIALAGPGATAESLVNEADAALLEAKQAGKDRVGWYSGRTSEAADR
ncbi:MAG: diguanylate cyclase [Actinomycetota bacterium]